jgi:hypothetical protein
VSDGDGDPGTFAPADTEPLGDADELLEALGEWLEDGVVDAVTVGVPVTGGDAVPVPEGDTVCEEDALELDEGVGVEDGEGVRV